MEVKQIESLTLGVDKLRNKEYIPQTAYGVWLTTPKLKAKPWPMLKSDDEYVSTNGMIMTLVKHLFYTQSCNEGSKLRRKYDLNFRLKIFTS